MAVSGIQESPQSDPLWLAFQEYMRRREVDLHSVTSMVEYAEKCTWDAFKAGAAAEHARIIDIFANNGVVLSGPNHILDQEVH